LAAPRAPSYSAAPPSSLLKNSPGREPAVGSSLVGLGAPSLGATPSPIQSWAEKTVEVVPPHPNLAAPQDHEGYAEATPLSSAFKCLAEGTREGALPLDVTPPSSPFKCSAGGTREVVPSLPHQAAPQDLEGHVDAFKNLAAPQEPEDPRCWQQELSLRKGLGNHPMMPMEEHSSIARASQHRL